MKTFASTMLFGLTILVTSTLVGAVEPHHSSDLAALEDSREMVAWRAQNAKGIEKHQLRQEEQRLQSFIDALKQGGRVETYEIDRALNRTRQ